MVVGRCANRIKGASFTLDGEIYKLTANNGGNALHGGTKGFDKQLWSAERIDHPDGAAVQLTRTSPDGEEVRPQICPTHSPVHCALPFTLANSLHAATNMLDALTQPSRSVLMQLPECFTHSSSPQCTNHIKLVAGNDGVGLPRHAQGVCDIHNVQTRGAENANRCQHRQAHPG